MNEKHLFPLEKSGFVYNACVPRFIFYSKPEHLSKPILGPLLFVLPVLIMI